MKTEKKLDIVVRKERKNEYREQGERNKENEKQISEACNTYETKAGKWEVQEGKVENDKRLTVEEAQREGK